MIAALRWISINVAKQRQVKEQQKHVIFNDLIVIAVSNINFNDLY